MSVRRRSTPARVGAGVMLAAACVLGPAAAHAAPVNGLVPAEGSCNDARIVLSSSTIEAGQSVTVSGDCYDDSTSVTITLPGNGQTDAVSATVTDGNFSMSIPVDEPGRYTVTVTSDSGRTHTESLTVTPRDEQGEPEDPADSEDSTDPEEPTDPSPEEPTDPEEPTEEEPTGPESPPEETPTSEDPTSEGPDEEAPTSEGPTSEEPGDSNPTPEGESPSVDPDPEPEGEQTDPVEDQDQNEDEGQNEDGGQNRPKSPTPEPSVEATSPTKDFPGSKSPAPSASGSQQPSSPRAGSDLPAAPETGTRDFPGSGKGKPQSPAAPQSLGALTLHIGEALTGLYGNSAEAPGADGAAPEGSNGDGELAETGAEITAAATFAALAMGAGAGMLWLQRRRDEN